jgi:hypothetical protein
VSKLFVIVEIYPTEGEAIEAALNAAEEGNSAKSNNFDRKKMTPLLRMNIMRVLKGHFLPPDFVCNTDRGKSKYADRHGYIINLSNSQFWRLVNDNIF